MDINEMLSSRTWLGIVIDNADPERRGRIKVRVSFVFDSIPDEDIPWAAPVIITDGKGFNIPDTGKIVNVNFYNGDLYSPEYICAEHYELNLQNLLESISDEDYQNFTAIQFDANLQIYHLKSKGFILDYKKTNINMTPDGDINMNLRDNKSQINMGSPDATQPSMLGKSWMEWFDTLMDTFSKGGFIGNLGTEVIPDPNLIRVYSQYKSLRSSFLSKNIWIVDNDQVKEQDRPTVIQHGDNYKINASDKDVKLYQQVQDKVQQENEQEQKEVYTPEKRDEPDDRSSDGDEDKNNVLQREVVVPKSMVDSIKVNTINSRLKIIDMFLPEDNYYTETTNKTSIWLHHTAGGGSAKYVIGGWKQRSDKVATSYVIGGIDKSDSSMNGSVYRAFDDAHYANHLGISHAQLKLIDNPASTKDIHRNSIGIELCNWGYLTQSNGKFFTYLNTEIPSDQVIDLGFSFRGYRYYHKYTPEQLNSLEQLLRYLMSKHGIVSKKRWSAGSFEFDEAAFKNQEGIFTHTNTRRDKFDCSPQPELLNLLNKISQSV